VVRDSAVGIATRYWLDCPGIEFRWERDFSHLSRPALDPAYPPSYIMGTGSFPEVKRPRRGVDPTPLSIAEVKERVELCFPPPRAGVDFSRVNFIVTFMFIFWCALNYVVWNRLVSAEIYGLDDQGLILGRGRISFCARSANWVWGPPNHLSKVCGGNGVG
jgi:hypothetical protein